MKDYREQARQFLNQMHKEAKEQSLIIPAHSIDHLCYRTSSQHNYQLSCSFFETQGKLLVEGLISNRLIATYKLDQPIIYKDQSIDLIEVPSPKKGSEYSQGFEHFEVVIDKDFDVFVKDYPHLHFDLKASTKEFNPDIKIQLKTGSIKFHHQSLEKVIEAELCRN